ncbi:hypothetical protein CVIRNUC_010163 [Coccomyxa viridis]|uniref:Uncharacterized protein n=1 Tax=Coccomyxa viridis TaxID=1274662 RepID=A0AAV1ILW4_9CHLO|nr:hypothetical protein CVIRNUC_010163 [Coccomyxa viridis]
MIPACRGPAQKNRLRLCAETEHVGPALRTLVVGFVKYNKGLCFFWGALCCAPVPYALQVCTATADTILTLMRTVSYSFASLYVLASVCAANVLEAGTMHVRGWPDCSV